MVSLDKLTGTQTTFMSTCWSVLPVSVQQQIEDGLSGVIRSLFPSIPSEHLTLIWGDEKDHRPVEFGAHRIMALLYIKCTHISEEFFLEHISSDAAMQFALLTENELVQPFSESSFNRLRSRLANIYETTGRDILQEITDMMNFAIEEEVLGSLPYNDLFDRVYRVDSLNISMHGSHMSRLELMYVVNRMNVNNIAALRGKDQIPSDLQHYLEKQDHNRVIYFKGTLAEVEAEAVKKGISVADIEAELEPVDATSVDGDSSVDGTSTENAAAATGSSENGSSNPEIKTEGDSKPEQKNKGEFNRKKRCALIARLRLADVIEESLAIQKLEQSLGLEDNKEYRLLSRAISEQTKQDAQGKIIPRENSEIEGGSLQNPFDDEGTCRTKDGKTEQGWTGNVVQRCGPGNYAVIVDRDLEPNIHSDQAFARDFYEKFGIGNFNPETGRWSAACVDGLYCNSYELKDLAASRGIKVFCGMLTGIAPDPILAGFNVDARNMTVSVCPNGTEIKLVIPHPEKEDFRIRMPAGTCSTCPNREKCGASTKLCRSLGR